MDKHEFNDICHFAFFEEKKREFSVALSLKFTTFAGDRTGSSRFCCYGQDCAAIPAIVTRRIDRYGESSSRIADRNHR